MKIAFAVETGEDLNAIVSSRFGRAAKFIVVEIEDEKVVNIKAVENPGSKVASGAAIKAIQSLINEKVDIVVAGAFGPNALSALEGAHIKHVTISGKPIKEALKEVIEK